MSGGRFLVSLTEVCTSEKKPGRSLLKMGDNYWMQEEPEHTGEGGVCGCSCSKIGVRLISNYGGIIVR